MGVYPFQDIVDQLNGNSVSGSWSPSDVTNRINDVVELYITRQDDSVDKVVAAGAIPYLVQLMKDREGEVTAELHIAALRGLLCIALSDRIEYSAAIANAGAIPYLLDFTSSHDVFLINVALNVLNRMTIQLGVNRMFPLSNRLEDLLKTALKAYPLTEISLTLVNRLLAEMTISEKEFKMCLSTLSNLSLKSVDVYLVNAALECLVLLSNFAKKPLGTYLLGERVMSVIAEIIHCFSNVMNYKHVVITGLGRCLSRLLKTEKRLVCAALEEGILEELYLFATKDEYVKNEEIQCEVSWAIAAITVHSDEQTVARILKFGCPSPLKFHKGRSNDEHRMAVALMSRVLSMGEQVEVFMQNHILPMITHLQQTWEWRVLASFLNALKTSLKEVKRGQGLNHVVNVMERTGGREVLLQLKNDSNPHARRVTCEILDLIE